MTACCAPLVTYRHAAQVVLRRIVEVGAIAPEAAPSSDIDFRVLSDNVSYREPLPHEGASGIILMAVDHVLGLDRN
jgi:hypothetical protein